jgi:hypothetical protein
MARSFNNTNVIAALPTNTSFESTCFSQQTQPDTANTSFASEFACQNFEEQASGSQEWARLRKWASQDSTQGSSSASFGSVDDDEFLKLFQSKSQEQSIPPVPPKSSSRDETGHSAAYRPMDSERSVSPQKSKTAEPLATNASLPTAGPLPKVSPAKLGPITRNSPHQKSPDNVTPVESPRKIAHRISSIPKQGLFVDDIPDHLRRFPYHVVFICQRIAIDNSLAVQEVMQGMEISTVNADPAMFWQTLQSHPNINNVTVKESRHLWAASKRRFDGFTFKGQINLRNKQTGPIFSLRLMPVQADDSCRFQRRFGSDRFIYLNTPRLGGSEVRGFTSEERLLIQEQWIEWLKTEHKFMGRKWRVFHLEPLKRTKKTTNKVHDKRIVMFATEGWGIEQPCSVGEMLDWFFCFAKNSDQSYCKAFARFDLGLSRTLPTLEFKPSQVLHVSDCLSNGETEAIEFNDVELSWPKVPKEKVMNDGCSVMSVGAAREIWKKYKRATGVSGPLPSAFQGRIAGAKGLWMISAESYTKDPEHLAIWIQISTSQLKFQPHDEDRHDNTYDPHRLTFEVSRYSSASSSSELHRSFIPIMVDRGVSKETIAGFMKEQLVYERDQLLDKLTDPVGTYDYVHKNGSRSRDSVDTAGLVTQPATLEDRIKMLLESGFIPTQDYCLAWNLHLFIKMQHARQEESLRAPLCKSTFLYGVADPIGVLKPEQIQVQFSTSFTDETTDETYLCLKDTDLLVGRHPACRRSDIQKVQAVVHPSLSHLVDVAVFPSRGQHPLADKLQGGDYDGDLFWLCWESKLVEPFKNAPAPVNSPDVAKYGIKTDKRKLSEIMDVNSLGEVDILLEKAFAFRERSSPLGIVTNYLEDQVYIQKNIYSPSLDQLCDIHDLLVDAAKQGYIFSCEDFERYKRSQASGLAESNPTRPAYKAAMEKSKEKKMSADDTKIQPQCHENVLDFLYFDVVLAQNALTRKCVRDVLAYDKTTPPDADLLYPYQQLTAQNNETINEELYRIGNQVEKIRITWNSASHAPDSASLDWNKTIAECVQKFRAITPAAPTHPDIKPLARGGPCAWETIRASTLYAKFIYAKQSSFVWGLAAAELARLKADGVPGTRAMVANIRVNLRPKLVKRVGGLCEGEDSEESGNDDFLSAVG